MSQQLDSTTATAGRTANLPANNAGTIAAWLYFGSLPASDFGVYNFSNSGVSDVASLRWNTASSSFRVGHFNEKVNFSSNPSTATWVYFFLRWNGSIVEGGWKTVAQSDFTGRKAATSTADTSTPNRIDVGSNPFFSASADMAVFRLSVWNEFVSDANLLTAAGTDLGYTTNINTHLPLTDGIASPWNDTSGNARHWTAAGTFSNGADPSFGGSNDPAGSAVAGATASATLAVQRNLAAAAVAGALASGTLSINRALTGAAIGAALGSATLTAFSSVWRIPTNAPNGTAVHATVFSGASPTYAILAQGTAIVAGGFVDIPGVGTIGAKAFAFVHNYNDNTATSTIRGGPAIATLTSL